MTTLFEGKAQESTEGIPPAAYDYDDNTGSADRSSFAWQLITSGLTVSSAMASTMAFATLTLGLLHAFNCRMASNPIFRLGWPRAATISILSPRESLFTGTGYFHRDCTVYSASDLTTSALGPDGRLALSCRQ